MVSANQTITQVGDQRQVQRLKIHSRSSRAAVAVAVAVTMANIPKKINYGEENEAEEFPGCRTRCGPGKPKVKLD